MSGAIDSIDGFAGPGGWDLAARALGLDPLGIELDDAACATRAAAGLRTVQADIAQLDPLSFAPVRLAIFSPPCQAFSMAGNGAGARSTFFHRALRGMGAGEAVDVDALDAACADPRAHLVLEPLRWVLALRPESVACEQVEPVLPLWVTMCEVLRAAGYWAWCGVLSAEQYGVPQTRRRAILLASLVGPVGRPPATHQRYVAPRKRVEATLGLFDAPEPERIMAAEDRGLLPWVSMAQALGWDEREAVGFPRRADTPSNRSTGSVELNGTDYRERDLRDASEPAFVLTEKARSWMRFRSNAMPNAAERSVDELAPTITGGHDHGERQWLVNTGLATPPVSNPEGRWHVALKAGTGEHEAERDASEPAPTLRFGGRLNTVAWTGERPATTVAGDPRVHPPGHKVNGDDLAAGRDGYEGRAGENAVRVSLAEALVLQSFPPDYPVQGTKTKQFEQVGNAIPPGLAYAVLRALPGICE